MGIRDSIQIGAQKKRKELSNAPIDIVLPWVDGNDTAWRVCKARYKRSEVSPPADGANGWYDSEIRYRDWENLHYIFRGIEAFAPWVRTVHLITWGHLPPWLNTSCPKLHIVRHEDYIPEEFLPTFNSHTIELNLHRIDGLAEQFIYFNDDMYLTAPVRPEDFFRNGLPCDAAVLNPIPMTRNIGHAEINNICIINDHFRKKDVIASNPFQWFTLRYGKYLLRNFLLYPWKSFVGLYEQHLPTSFLKDTFALVWDKEADELTRTCACRFRDPANVNQWLFKNWQIVTGKFVPRGFDVGRMFMMGEEENYGEIFESIRSKRWKMICINDSHDIDDYPRRKAELRAAFDAILPERCAFEI